MKKRYGLFALLVGFTSPVIAGDIGHGIPNSGAEAMPVEEPETTESSSESFFDELLDFFLLGDDG